MRSLARGERTYKLERKRDLVRILVYLYDIKEGKSVTKQRKEGK